jgi:Ran GTPase-activating protein (RanGAP) involved in mRNA processing and transport
LERLPRGAQGHRALTRQVNALLKANAERWTQPLRDADLGYDWQFRRGFLDAVTISATEFVSVAKQLFQLAPTIRSVRFPEASNEVNGLARSRYLARLSCVDLRHMCECGYCPIERELRNLFKSPHAANITTLNLAADRIDAEGARALAKSKYLTRLTSLDLSNNPLGNEGVMELAESKRLKQLVTLNLSHTELGAAGAHELAKAKNMPALTHLTLSRNEIGPAGAQALAASPLVSQLTTLDLSKNEIGDAGAKSLAKSSGLKMIEMLDVRNNQISASGVKALRTRFGKRVKV